MTQHFYTQVLTGAFEDAVGNMGADRARYQYWLDVLVPKIPALKSSPQREAAPVLALPDMTEDLAEIEAIGKHIAAHFKALVVVGMGGSSLSGESLAFIRKPGAVAVKFIDNIDPHSIAVLCENLVWKDTFFLVVSKSGATIETLAQMSVLLRRAKAAGIDYARHFRVITMTDGNVLQHIAQEHGIPVLAHDPKLGGRFSILSAVGLIPAMVMGLDIRALRRGAQSTLNMHSVGDMRHAPAVQSAAMHMALHEKQVRMQVFMHYCDRMGGIANWFRQCWGESLGKCDAATTPVRSRMSTDQHSQLQLYLDGPKDKFFTLMVLDSRGQGEAIDFDASTDARLQFLRGKTLGDLMVAQQRATISSLQQRGCPVRQFMVPDVTEEVYGALLMHFALEIMFTARLMGVNAFDQPAVEDSKKFALNYLGEVR